MFRLRKRGLLQAGDPSTSPLRRRSEGLTLNIGVLVSGRGSNLEAILESVENGAIPNASVKVVFSNDPSARALQVAKNHGVAAETLEQSGLSREEYDRRIEGVLQSHGVGEDGLVLLAGYMKLLGREFVERRKGRIMNIHPSLLPSFPGVNAQEQALTHGVKVTGCTVHFVVPEVDAGPIIAQQAVRVEEGDDVEKLSARILAEEHRLFPKAVGLFAAGKLRVERRRVMVL